MARKFSRAMEKKSEPEIPDAFLWLKDLPEKSAPEQFTEQQLIDCEVCGRKNAPTRLACLYCGAALKVVGKNAALARLVLRRLEPWEKGWNVVHLPRENESFSNEFLGLTADFLRLEREELGKILTEGQILPVAQTESAEEAELIQNFLRERGLNVATIADVNLQIDLLPNRVRGLEFGENEMTLFLLGKEEIITLFYDEIKLFVTGAIFERQVENREQRKGKNRFEIKDSRETSSDENVLDFYTASERAGFRISSRNFDFSCLGAEKKLLANENFQTLLEQLKAKATRATFDDSYKKARAVLNFVWQPEQRSESRGWQREGLGKISIENRLTISNAAQFLRYSRMLRELQGQKLN